MKEKLLYRFFVKIRQLIVENWKCILASIIFLSLVPAIVNFLVTTKAFFIPRFFGFVTSDTKSAWIGFYGSIIGGGITLVGVAWTIVDQNKKRKEDIQDAVKPIIVSEDCSDEKLIEREDCPGDSIVFRFTISYKNVGKGILYNPSLYNIIFTIDEVPITTISPSLPVLSYLDVTSSAKQHISVTLDQEIRSELYNRLKDRGNTLKIKAVIYVGGNDIFGRTFITKLVYTRGITWFSPQEIELGLSCGNLYSEVLFDEKDISEALKNRDWRYGIHTI